VGCGGTGDWIYCLHGDFGEGFSVGVGNRNHERK
jgi:hypothetical protein